MKKNLIIAVALMSLTLLSVYALPIGAKSQTQHDTTAPSRATTTLEDGEYVPNEIILKLNENAQPNLAGTNLPKVASLNRLAETFSIEHTKRILPNVYKLTSSAPLDVLQAARQL
jgi:hypothetical protein